MGSSAIAKGSFSCLINSPNSTTKFHFGLSQISLPLRGKSLNRIRSRPPFSVSAMGASSSSQKQDTSPDAGNVNYSSISEQEWRKKLTDQQFCVTRQKGTERAFTG